MVIKKANAQQLQDWGVSPRPPQRPKDNQIEVVPPRAYQGLQVGPDFGISYEDAESVPVSASSEILRNLSPFTLQVEPPVVFGNVTPTSSTGAQKRVRVFQAATAATGESYSNARSLLSEVPYSNLSYGGSVGAVIARNSAGPRNRGPADDTKGVNKDGWGDQARLGEPAIADLEVAVDIAMQISAVMNTPPLILLINPQSLQVSYTKVQAFQDRSRNGYIFQAWGESQPQIMISARIGAFISGSRGVQFASRRDSSAYQNLMNVLHFYKNNGYIHDTIGRSNAHHHVGALSIRYDQWVYYGNMQSMSFTQDDTSTVNGGINFEMNFVASAMVDTAPNVRVVQPMKSPNPNPGDPRLMGGEAFNRVGSLSSFTEASVDKFFGNLTGKPPLVAQGVVQTTPASVRATSQPVGSRAFQAASPAPEPVPQQAPVSSRSLAVPFTSARSGINLP